MAIAYAVKYPEKVSHLILYGGYAQGCLKRNLTPQKIEEIEMMTKLIELGWGRDNPAFRQLYTSLFIPEGTLEQLHWFNDLQRISTSPQNAAKFVDTFNQIDVCDLATQIQVPTRCLSRCYLVAGQKFCCRNMRVLWIFHSRQGLRFPFSRLLEKPLQIHLCRQLLEKNR